MSGCLVPAATSAVSSAHCCAAAGSGAFATVGTSSRPGESQRLGKPLHTAFDCVSICCETLPCSLSLSGETKVLQRSRMCDVPPCVCSQAVWKLLPALQQLQQQPGRQQAARQQPQRRQAEQPPPVLQDPAETEASDSSQTAEATSSSSSQSTTSSSMQAMSWLGGLVKAVQSYRHSTEQPPLLPCTLQLCF